MATEPARPDGITAEHEAIKWNDSFLPLLLVAGFLLAGLMGFFGGQSDQTWSAENETASLEIHTPEVLRNGMIYETQIEVRAKQPIGELVVAISEDLWQQSTVNTVIPAATEETFADGAYRFSFGDLDAGDTFLFKIDAQINPALLSKTIGEIAIFDGGAKILSVPLSRRSLP